MDLQLLREETRPEHEATEAAMPLMGPGLTLDTYKTVLGTLLPILRGWETWAESAAPESVRPLLAARRRSHLLEADLRALGEPVPPSQQLWEEPIDWTSVVNGKDPNQTSRSEREFEAAFLGAFYVLEGSTLGGRMIARHIQPMLGLEDGQGDAYFRVHGD